MANATGKMRLGRFQGILSDQGLAAALIWLPAHQLYLSGFLAHIYSRPIFTFITPSTSLLVVPELEEAHARHRTVVDHVLPYRETPGAMPSVGGADASALGILDGLLADLPRGQAVGIEAGVLPWRWGQAVADRGFRVVDIGPAIYRMREVKDEAEQGLLRTAGRLVSVAVQATVSAFRPGTTEPLAELEGHRAALELAAKEIADADVDLVKTLTASGVEKSAQPHAYTTNRILTTQDLGIHRRHVAVGHYGSECERTFFIGAPSAELRRMFEVMCEAQQAAIETLRSGVLARDVDSAAREVITRAGYGPYFIHRTGHSIGLQEHEMPDLRHDSDRVLETGMVVTVEPGIYVPGVGGVRHSDTFIVTQSGSECITFGPKDLDSCIVWR